MEINTLEQMLAGHPFFQGMSAEHVKLLTGCAKNVRFEPGQAMFREGQLAETFYLLRSGRVAIELFAPGRGAVVLQTLGEGEVLGWSWILEPFTTRFDVRAIELTRALALDGSCLRAKFDADPRLGYDLMKRFARVISERLEATRFELLDVYGDAQ